ncbi:hypothetical protein LCGC14_0188190 [marine sediment metagenome]
MSLGNYPAMGLTEARVERDRIKHDVKRGNDPAPQPVTPEAEPDDPTFGEIAEEYLSVMIGEGRTEKTIYKNRRFLMHYARPLLPKPMREIGPAEILRLCKTIEAEGKHETAHRVKAAIGKVFRYAIQTERAEVDPTQPLAGALLPLVHQPHPAILDEREFGLLVAGCGAYEGSVAVRAGLQIMILCVPRPVELRLARRQEIDLKKRLWTIPAERTKMRRVHVIPLSRQAVRIFEDVIEWADGDMLFPGARSGRPMSDAAMSMALRRLGYTNEEHSVHGFRSSFSTIMNERGARYDVIEAALSHLDPNETRRIYNRTAYLKERVGLMQDWADLCDDMQKRASRRAEIAAFV